MNALIYTRRSKEAEERTVSLSQQMQDCETYIRERGWMNAARVEDNGVSGGDARRFVRIDTALRQNKAYRLVVYSLDRLGRDTAGTLHWLKKWGERGVEVHVVGRGVVEVGSANGLLVNGIEALTAEHYRATISEKTKAALRHLREQGKRYSGRAPYGYRYEKGAIVRDEGEQQSIRAIRANAGQPGDTSLRKLAKLLYGKGIESRAGTPFSHTTLKAILGSKGHTTSRTDELYSG